MPTYSAELPRRAAARPFAVWKTGLLAALGWLAFALYSSEAPNAIRDWPYTRELANLSLAAAALLLALTHGFMGVLTPYATTSGPVYLGSGYITSAEFWRLGAIFGALFLIALLALSAPFLFWMQWI